MGVSTRGIGSKYLSDIRYSKLDYLHANGNLRRMEVARSFRRKSAWPWAWMSASQGMP